MEEPRPISRPYVNHRESQRERILEVAEQLFVRDGIDGVNLSAIARAAGLTRNTVYEYFPNKQEVAWAILQKIFEAARSERASRPEWNGLQRLEHFMLERIREVETHPEHLRFIVEFNTLYAREANPERMRGLGGSGNGGVSELVCQGIADGSLRADLDPDLTSAAVRNLLSGMNARFALLGGLIAREYGQPVMAIYMDICRAFLRGIQAESRPTVYFEEKQDAETEF